MKRLLIYDVSDNGLAGLSWKAGAILFKPCFDKILAVKSWMDFESKLAELDEKYDEVQFWGHGSPGHIYIKGEASPDLTWSLLSNILNKYASVWLRVCSFAATDLGKSAMEWISVVLDARLIAHTYSVGEMSCQSGVRAVMPTQRAMWLPTEGMNENKATKSAPWHSNTVLAFQMSPPVWASNGGVGVYALDHSRKF